MCFDTDSSQYDMLNSIKSVFVHHNVPCKSDKSWQKVAHLVKSNALATCEGMIRGWDGGFAIKGGWEFPVPEFVPFPGIPELFTGHTIQMICKGLETGSTGQACQGSHKALEDPLIFL